MEKTTIENAIKENGFYLSTIVGDSMMPLLRNRRDTVKIIPVRGRLKKYDVPLYKRGSGQYVLHRIIKVHKDDYVICGDNRWQKEYGITDHHIIGVLTGVIRNGKTISVNNKNYRLYVHLWCDFFHVRALILRVKNYLKRRIK